MNRPANAELNATVRMLVVNAREDLIPVLPQNICHAQVNVQHVRGVNQACERLKQETFEVVIADIDIPTTGSVDLLRRLHDASPDAKVIVVSSGRSPSVMADLLRERAYSILLRPVVVGRLAEVVEHAIASTDWRDDIRLISGAPSWVQIEVRCKLSAAERAVQIFRELPGSLEPQEHDELTTAFREMLMNAIEHGGQSDPNQTIFISMVWSKRDLMFYIRDPGEGFSLQHLPHAAISNPDGVLEHAEVREQKGIRPGGFGILLARNLVDELIYSERGNEVILIKYRQHYR